MGYLKNVKNAIKEVAREAVGDGRGDIGPGKATQIAAGRAALTIKGHGDQGRCSNGQRHCGRCANCTAGSEHD